MGILLPPPGSAPPLSSLTRSIPLLSVPSDASLHRILLLLHRRPSPLAHPHATRPATVRSRATQSRRDNSGRRIEEVFDWDRFKYDDKMGHAFLDLQPVAAATKLRRALQLTTAETKLRKVAPSADNCLLSDSFVTYADGEVVLDARLRLRDVESGELFITIKWIEADAK